MSSPCVRDWVYGHAVDGIAVGWVCLHLAKGLCAVVCACTFRLIGMSARALKIKTGTATRTRKELLAYTTELTKERAKLDAMKAAAGDRAQIKQQVRARRMESSSRRLPRHCTGERRSYRCPVVSDSGWRTRLPPATGHRPRGASRGWTARPPRRRCGHRKWRVDACGWTCGCALRRLCLPVRLSPDSLAGGRHCGRVSRHR